MPCLRIGHDLANEQALMNFEAVLIGLHATALGDEFGLSRQNVRPARRGLPKKLIDADGPRAFAREFVVHRHGMAAEKSPRGIGRQMNNRLTSSLLGRCPPRAQRHASQQRAAVADRRAQVGGGERRGSVVAGEQKRFGLGARQRGSENTRMLIAGKRKHRTPSEWDRSVGRRTPYGNKNLSQSRQKLSTSVERTARVQQAQ